MSEDKDVRTAEASVKSKHDAASVVQRRRTGLRSRTHAKPTPDGRYKCVECGFISGTLEAADAHHFRTHERHVGFMFEHTPP